MKINKLFRIYILNRVMHWLIVGVNIPVITMILLDKELDFLQIGLIFSIQSATVVLFELPSGAMSDAIGRKKVYLLALIMMLLCSILFMFSYGFNLLCLVVIINGLAQALSSGTIEAWFVDEFNKIDKEENLQEFLSKAQIATLISLSVSSVVGGILPKTLGKLIKDTFGLSIYSGNFTVQIVLLIIHLTVTILLIKEASHESRNRSILGGVKTIPTVLKISIKEGIENRCIFLLLTTAIAWGIGFSGLETFWQPKVKIIVGLTSDDSILGILNAGYFFAGAAGSFIITYICKLFKNDSIKILIVLRSMLGGFFILLAFQSNIIGFSICYLMLYSINGMSESPYYTIFNRKVKERNRATLLSLESLFMKAGAMIGMVMMGYVSQKYSISFGWIISGGVMILSSLAFIVLYKIEKLNNNILE